MRVAMEPLTYQYGVDLFFYGAPFLPIMPICSVQAGLCSCLCNCQYAEAHVAEEAFIKLMGRLGDSEGCAIEQATCTHMRGRPQCTITT